MTEHNATDFTTSDSRGKADNRECADDSTGSKVMEAEEGF